MPIAAVTISTVSLGENPEHLIRVVSLSALFQSESNPWQQCHDKIGENKNYLLV